MRHLQKLKIVSNFNKSKKEKKHVLISLMSYYSWGLAYVMSRRRDYTKLNKINVLHLEHFVDKKQFEKKK